MKGQWIGRVKGELKGQIIQEMGSSLLLTHGRIENSVSKLEEMGSSLLLTHGRIENSVSKLEL